VSKTIIITGASKGIGRSAAEVLLKAGYRCALAARRTDSLRELADQYPDQTLLQPADVSRIEEVKRLVEATVKRFGGVGVLVNNAGLGTFDPIQDGKPDEWDRMIDVNIKGVLYAIHAVLPHMLQQQDGHIINLASVAGHHVYPNGAVYAATKHAVRAISEGIRQDLRGKVRVTTISPGAVNTPFPENISNPELRVHFEENLGNGLDPAVVAQAIHQAIAYPDKVMMSEIILRPFHRQ